MITYLLKDGFDDVQVTYARPARVRAFIEYLEREVPGSKVVCTEVGSSSASVSGSIGAIARLARSLRAVASSGNSWVVVDYPNFPASVPRRFSVFAVATTYLLALRAIVRFKGMGLVVQVDDDPAMQDVWLGGTVGPSALRFERSFERLLLRSADDIWTCAQALGEMLCERFDLPGAKMTHVPNGAAARRRTARAKDARTCTFVYAGALLPETHCVKALISSFSAVENARARLVLAGPEGEWIASHLSENPDARVTYAGCLPLEDVPAMLDQCDVGVLTGQADGYYRIGFPGKFGTYLVAGLPVIATVRGDAESLISTTGNGVVCDLDDLTGVMKRLADDRGELAEMTDQAVSIADDYTWERIYLRAVGSLTVRRSQPRAASRALEASE